MLAIQHLKPGTRLKLTDGTIAELRENPRDGTWLIVSRLPPAETAEGGDLVHIDEIDEVAGA
ncbi:MAG TPA: hypothetical protein VHW66_18680 [Stellaceae bacterium]|jgi:hypothetical protein|nr:hypothetical protein [Stellaceae bacterium]